MRDKQVHGKVVEVVGRDEREGQKQEKMRYDYPLAG